MTLGYSRVAITTIINFSLLLFIFHRKFYNRGINCSVLTHMFLIVAGCTVFELCGQMSGVCIYKLYLCVNYSGNWSTMLTSALWLTDTWSRWLWSLSSNFSVCQLNIFVLPLSSAPHYRQCISTTHNIFQNHQFFVFVFGIFNYHSNRNECQIKYNMKMLQTMANTMKKYIFYSDYRACTTFLNNMVTVWWCCFRIILSLCKYTQQ